MGPKGSLDWLVEDSEDEGEGSGAQPAKVPLPPPPPLPHVQPQASEISEFTVRDAHPPLNKASSISQFTNDTPNADKGKTIISATASSDVSSVAAPDKPKPRPRPRPAFKGHLSKTDSIESASSASRVASALNALNSGMSSIAPVLDSPYPLDIAERAKMRRQAKSTEENGFSSKPSSISVSSSLSRKVKEIGQIVIDLSSDDDQRRPAPASSSLSGRTTVLNTSDPPQQSSIPFPIPPLPRRFDLPPSDPPSSSTALTSFERILPNNASTPPSSPFPPRQAKRRKITVDEETFDPAMVDKPVDASEASAAPKKKKERKPREKKAKTKAIEPGVGSGAGVGEDANASLPAPKKRKAKEGAKEPEYKSKEFIDTSDDDIDFIASKPTKDPPPTPSVPASAQLSVPPSAAVSDLRSTGTATVASSASAPPSAPISAPPTVPISAPPSAALPSLPSVPHITITPLKDQPKKKKRPSNVLEDVDIDKSSVEPGSRNTEIDNVPRKRARKEKKARPEIASIPDKSANEDFDIDEAIDSIVNDSIKTKTTKKKIAFSDDDDSEVEHSVAKPASTSSIPAKAKPKSSASDKPKSSKKRKRIAIASDDDSEDDGNEGSEIQKSADAIFKTPISSNRLRSEENKENNKGIQPSPKPLPESSVPPSAPKPLPRPRAKSSTPHTVPREGSIAALIRRVSSKINSPLASPSPGGYASPLARSSRSALSRIAPLHPNRKEPPPPPPRPPAPKKSKKMLDLEEKWEEELAETVEGWSCMADEERAALRRAKRDRELGYDD